MTPIKNRLEKNLKKLLPWARRIPTEAWRLYDRDIPEYPFIVDIYGDHLVIADRSNSVIDAEKNHAPHLLEALKEIFKVSDDKLVFKNRVRQEGTSQYEKMSEQGVFMNIREGKALFRVNLFDYLDTGLFLDHRPIRHKIFQTSSQKKVLNLFCYTGSVSVCAALGGGFVTSVDMSATYVDWARENFRLNEIALENHQFIQADALQWLEEKPTDVYDLIFLDPPTFSNSKRMRGNFEVERDQESLVEDTMKRLVPGGVLYFSNNKRGFRLSEKLQAQYLIDDITKDTIPPDFHDQKIHRCFRLRHR